MKKSLIVFAHAYDSVPPEQIAPLEKFDMSNVGKYSSRLVRYWRKLDLLTCYMSVLGLFFSILEYELSYSDHRTHKNCKQSNINTLRYLTLLTSIFATFFAYSRYRTQSRFYKIQLKNPYKEHYKHLYSRSYLLKLVFIIECLILWLFPYPSLDSGVYFYQASNYIDPENLDRNYSICYTNSEILLVIMSLRFYFLVKCALNNSSYRDIFSTYYCNKFNTRAGFRFAMKSLIAGHQYFLIFVVILPSILILAQLLRIFERPNMHYSDLNFNDYSNSIWCLLTTMSTIGYGDFYPTTYGGRTVCIISTFWGGFSLSWVIIVISDWVYLSPEEEKALEKIEQLRKNPEKSLSIGMSILSSKSIMDQSVSYEPRGKRTLNTFYQKLFEFETKLNQKLANKLN